MNKTFLLSVAALLTTASAAPLKISPQASGPEFVTEPTAKARLVKLMGVVNYTFLRKSFETISTLQNDASIVAFSGCKAHDCGNNDALIIYDRHNDVLKAKMHIRGKTYNFQEKGKLNTAAYNTNLKNTLNQ